MTLEDVYIGVRKQLEISRYRFCESCLGKGTNKKGVNPKCKSCKGKGIKVVLRQIQLGIIQQQVNCDDCQGKYIYIL